MNLNNNTNFLDFLKKEFSLLDFSNNNSNNQKKDTIVDIDEIFRIEKNKKDIIKKIKKHNRLEDILDKKLKDEAGEDIDKKIQENWNQVFERIHYELLNAQRVLSEDEKNNLVNKKNKKVFQFKNYNLVKNKNSESLIYHKGISVLFNSFSSSRERRGKLSAKDLTYVWFGGFVVVSIVFLMFFTTLNLFEIQDNKELALKYSNNSESQVQIYRKASISQEAKSEYIKNNQQQLEEMLDEKTIQVDLNDSLGQVAGVMEENKIFNKKDNKNFYQEILDLFINLF